MSVDKNTEAKRFDRDEAENLGNFQEFGGASAESVETARVIIADERKLVADGAETAEDGEEVVADRIEAALDSGDDEGCGCDCGGCL